MRLKALIFDVDGTLADTEEAHRCAFNEAFLQLGLPWNWSKPKYAHLLLTAGGKERLAAYIDSLDLPAAGVLKLMGRIEAIHRAKTLNYTRMVLAGAVPLRDGVARLIDDAARSRVRLCIATTTTFANVEALLRTALGPTALDRFAVIVTAPGTPDIVAADAEQQCLTGFTVIAAGRRLMRPGSNRPGSKATQVPKTCLFVRSTSRIQAASCSSFAARCCSR